MSKKAILIILGIIAILIIYYLVQSRKNTDSSAAGIDPFTLRASERQNADEARQQKRKEYISNCMKTKGLLPCAFQANEIFK